MLIYYDNRLRLLLKQFIFRSGSSACPATAWIISGQRNRRKNDADPAPELLVFMSVAPVSVRLHTLIS